MLHIYNINFLNSRYILQIPEALKIQDVREGEVHGHVPQEG